MGSPVRSWLWPHSNPFTVVEGFCVSVPDDWSVDLPLQNSTQAELKRNDQDSRYEIFVDGQMAGFATFTDVDGARELPHTFVDPKFRGQGLSGPLMQYALDDARAEGLAVIPTCPAVARYVAQHPEYADLVE